ncbi:MAG: hypothetical protein R3F61_08050 [Myxococcota bacterium]
MVLVFLGGLVAMAQEPEEPPPGMEEPAALTMQQRFVQWSLTADLVFEGTPTCESVTRPWTDEQRAARIRDGQPVDEGPTVARRCRFLIENPLFGPAGEHVFTRPRDSGGSFREGRTYMVWARLGSDGSPSLMPGAGTASYVMRTEAPDGSQGVFVPGSTGPFLADGSSAAVPAIDRSMSQEELRAVTEAQAASFEPFAWSALTQLITATADGRK